MQTLQKIFYSFRKAIKGEEALGVVFWGWFVTLLILCWVIGFFLKPIVYSYLHFPLSVFSLNIITIPDIALTLVFRIFLVVLVWKCASNTKYKFWGYISRIIIVLFALLTLYGTTLNILDIVQYDISKSHIQH